MFPISLEGSIDTHSISPEQVNAVTERLVSALNRARASSVVCDGNTVTFRGGMFRLVFNWNVLVPVSRGTITISSGSRDAVRFNLSCVEMLVVTTVMAICAGFVIPSGQPALFRFGAPVLMWLWLFGMNYVIAAYRLPAFIRRAVGA